MRACELVRMWDMSRFVMIVISLYRGKTLSFGAYELLVMLLSRDSGGYSGVYETKSALNDVFLSSPLLFHMLTCDLTGCFLKFQFLAGRYVR